MVDVLADRVSNAMRRFRESHFGIGAHLISSRQAGSRQIRAIRQTLAAVAAKQNFALSLPPI